MKNSAIEMDAIKRAEEILKKSRPASPNHPYLIKKGVKPNGIFTFLGDLIIPIYDVKGALKSLQIIDENGQKKFLRGGKIKGHVHIIHGDDKKILLAEGYVTGVSLHEATGYTVVIVFTSNNFENVIVAIRSVLNSPFIIICADDDSNKVDSHFHARNPGLDSAVEAAWSLNVNVVTPTFPDDSKNFSDFNDLQNISGSKEIKKQIECSYNPMNKILEECKSDPSIPFEPDTLKQLCFLKKNNQKRYIQFIDKAKKLNVQITELKKSVDLGSKQNGGNNKTNSEKLVEIALNNCSLFHDSEFKSYADIFLDDHVETWAIKSFGFKNWLLHQNYKLTKKTPGNQSVNDALSQISSLSHYLGGKIEIHIRLAGDAQAIYVDTGNKNWEKYKITSDKIEVIKESPIKFRRPRGMEQLPYISNKYSFDGLRSILNLKRDEDWILLLSWIIGALKPDGPYPILVLTGEQGTAKSSASRILKRLIDPTQAPIRMEPRNPDDLIIAASNSHVLSYDNLSGLSGWFSDSLCRLSTGGGMSKRQLFTDGDEYISNAKRPTILNGISDIIRQHDLMNRVIIIQLGRIPDHLRKTEAEIEKDFRKYHPEILHAIFKAVSCALKNYSNIKLKKLPRMADFALWVTASEPALPFENGAFLKAYDSNQANAISQSIESDLVASTIIKFMEKNPNGYSSPVSKLYDKLCDEVSEKESRSKEWPKASNALSRKLRRSVTFLRSMGVDIDFCRGSDGKSEIHLIVEKRESEKPIYLKDITMKKC